MFRRHKRVADFLQTFQQFHIDGWSGSYLCKLVPHNKQTVVNTPFTQFVLHLYDPVAQVFAVHAHIELVFP